MFVISLICSVSLCVCLYILYRICVSLSFAFYLFRTQTLTHTHTHTCRSPSILLSGHPMNQAIRSWWTRICPLRQLSCLFLEWNLQLASRLLPTSVYSRSQNNALQRNLSSGPQSTAFRVCICGGLCARTTDVVTSRWC